MLGIQDKAPDLRVSAVVGQEIKELALADFRGKWLVLFFYPLDFTFVCPTEIIEFSRRGADFRNLNAQVVGASCDSVYSHKAWLEQLGELNYPLVADYNKELAKAFGVLLADGFPSRATFIIDPEGRIQHASANNPNVGRSVAETLRVLEAAQTGQKVPVEWRRGEPTLEDKPSVGAARR